MTNNSNFLPRKNSLILYMLLIVSMVIVGSIIWLTYQSRYTVSEEISNVKLNANNARKIAQMYVEQHSTDSGHMFSITKVLEHSDGWTFFYDTVPGGIKGVPGNVPFVVNFNGKIKVLPNPQDPLRSDLHQN